MPRSIVNLMLSIAAAIAAVPVYFLTGTLCDRGVIRLGSEFPWTYVFGAFATLLIAFTWAMIWRREIRWTRRRALGSAGAYALGWLVTAGLGFVLKEIFHGEEIEMFLPLLGTACTLAGVVVVWGETDKERLTRSAKRTVLCPGCGYDLSGAHQTACPECGRAFTLAQLGVESESSD